MKPTPKVLGWVLLFLLLLWISKSGSLNWAGNGDFNLSINGHAVEGPAKFVLAPVVALLGVVGTILGMVMGALAVAGSGFIVLVVLILVGLMVAGLFIPFLMPLIVPIAVIIGVILATRQTKPALIQQGPPRLN
jgi:hypothetical protein